MTLKNKKILWTVLASVLAVLFIALIVGTSVARYYYVIVDRYLNCKRTDIEYYDENGNRVEPGDETEGKFKSEFSSEEEKTAEQTLVSPLYTEAE